MITLLEELVERADGSYANKQDLRALEHVMSSWADRKETYFAVQEKETEIVDGAMKLLQKNATYLNNAAHKASTERCRRDLNLMLRSFALAMLLQDEEMLKDRFLYWQKNILQAMNLRDYQGHRLLLESICTELSGKQADLLKPYFKVASELYASN